LIDYQVLITLDNAFNFTAANNDGNDIRFTADDGITKIPFWIESFDPVAEDASIWVKVPEIPVAGTAIFLYYGNATPPGPAIVEGPPDGPYTKVDDPIIPIGDPQNGEKLLPENMVYDDETGHWWLIFNNYRSGPSSIGLAWSDDPTNPNAWHWYEGNPIVTAGDAPHIMKEGDTWYVFYGDLSEWINFPNIRWDVAVSRSTTGITGPYDGTIHQYGHTGRDIVLPHGGDGEWDWYRADEPYVFQRNDGKWIMAYMGDRDGYWPGLEGVTEQVGYAYADDIMGPYTKFAGNPIIPYGPPGSFDEGVVADPWVYEFDGTYYIGYAGVANTNGIGSVTAYVTTEDWQTFTKKPILVTTGPPGSFDFLASARGACTRVGDEYIIIYFARPIDWVYRMNIAVQPVYAPEPINDPKEVFDLYDGFDGTSLDTQNWFENIVTGGSASVSGGVLTLTGQSSSSSWGFIRLKSSFPVNNGTLLECRAAHPTNAPPYDQVNNAQVGYITYDFQWTNHMRLKDGPNLQYYEIRGAKDDNDSQNTLTTIPFSTYPPENFRTYSVYRPSIGVAKFRIDNSPFATLSSQYVPVIGNIYPYLMSYSNTNKPESRFEVDWIRVRKFVEPEPTASLGSVHYLNSEWTGTTSTDWSTSGNWSTDVPESYSKVTIPSAPANQPHISASATSPSECDDLTIESGAEVTIDAGKALTVTGTLTNSGDLTIKSDNTGTGSLIEYSGINVTVERYLTDDDWHYVSPPVDDPTANVFLGLYLMSWDEPSGEWTFIVDPATVLDTDMEGYAVWANDIAIVEFDGSLNTGTKTRNTTNTFGAAHDNKGFNFAGNPYPSSLNWNINDGSGWERTAGNIDMSLYIWNGVAGNYGVYVKDASGGTNDVDSIIPPHQGFFVRCSAATGYLSVDDGARVHGFHDILKSPDNKDEDVLILKVSGNGYSDEIMLRHLEQASVNYDKNLDALKFRGSDEAPQLGSVSADHLQLSVNTFPASEMYTIIPLLFEAPADGEYTFSLMSSNGFLTEEISLEDLQTNTRTGLNEGDFYKFYANADDETNRFLLHLKTGDEEIPEWEDQVVIYSFDNMICVRVPENTGQIFVYNLLGQEVRHIEIDKTTTYIHVENTGSYIVRVLQEGTASVKKVVVK